VPVLLTIFYRPPYSDLQATNYIDLLIRFLKQHSVANQNTGNFVVGDFNCPKIDWTRLVSPNDYISKSLLNRATAAVIANLFIFLLVGKISWT